VAYYTHRLITPEALVCAGARGRLIGVAVISPLVAVISAYRKTRFDRIRERDRAARAEAEAAERRSRFLAEASRALSASLDHEVTLANLAALAVTDVSDYCIIHVRGEDGVIRQVAAAHADPAKEPLLRELERRLTPDPDDPASVVARVLRNGEPGVIAEVPQGWAAGVRSDPEVDRVDEALDPRAAVVVPWLSHGEVLGAITLVRSGGAPRFGAED